MHSRRALLLLSVAGCALACFGLAHAGLESLARRLEVHLGAYLCAPDEQRQLMLPAQYLDRGRDRLLLCGSSEAREGFIEEIFDARVPGLTAFQFALSMGTLADLLLQLEYLEQAYGESAMPEVLVIGLAPRMLSDLGFYESPLAGAIDAYSPHFSVDREAVPPRLLEKDALAGLAARYRWRSTQTQRYKNALRAATRAGLPALCSPPPEPIHFGAPLEPAQYHRRQPLAPDGVRAILARTQNPVVRMQSWDFSAGADRIRAELTGVAAIAGRHGTDIYLVLMPQHPASRERFRPGVYESYVQAVREALPHAPLLDSTHLLPAAEYYDHCHPDERGARRLSERAAEFVREHRTRSGALRRE